MKSRYSPISRITGKLKIHMDGYRVNQELVRSAARALNSRLVLYFRFL
jgi:hypothetical protein